MVGRMRDGERVLARNWGSLALLPVVLAACGGSPGGFSGSGSFGPDSAAVGGAAGGSTISGPDVGIGGEPSGIAGAPNAPGGGLSCSPPLSNAPVFGPQSFNDLMPARAELYSWVSDDQAAAMRKGRAWLPSVASTDPVNGTLAVLMADTGAKGQVAQTLSASLATARVAWQGEDPGKNLLRIVLKPEAWVAVLERGSLEVLDMQNRRLAFADVAAAPERLGAIVHVHDSSEGGPSCNGDPGTGSVGYRQIIVGNLAMISEWSLATEQIQNHLMANITQLSEYLARTRSCPEQSQRLSWNEQVLCNWQLSVGPGTEPFAYQQALAVPSLDYYDAPPQLGALIDRLEQDLFELDPLIVTPGSP
jgi:hypothetical protein